MKRAPLRLAPLGLLAVLALAALAMFASPGVGQAQGNAKTPSAPTITLFGCTNGCIAVDVALSTFTDGTAFDFAKYFSRQQVYPTTKMVPDTSKCETVTHRYFDYKGDPNPKVTTGINVGVGDAAPGLGDDLPDWVRAAASKAIPMVWDADNNVHRLPSLTGAKDRVRVWDIYPKRYQPTADEEAARARYGNNYCVHPEAQVREQRLIVEMQWRYSSDDNWQNWRLQQGPAYTGVRFQSLTRRGQFEVRNLEYNTAYQVRARVHHNGTDGLWSEPQTFTTKPFPAVQNFRMKVNPEGVTLSWDDPPSDDPGFDNHPNGFDGYFVAVNANGQCECAVPTVPGETWASWVTGNSVTVKGFNPGQTVQACIRPAIGSRGGTTQRSANKTIGWPAGTVAGVPGAPGAPSLGYGEMFGSTKAPPYGYAGEVSLWDHYADIGDVPTQYPPLLDWDKLYITWDRAAQNGAYITKSEWQYRERGTSEWLHGGSVEGRTKRWGIHEKQVWEDPNTIAQRVLRDGVVYEFRVRSRSSAGWGPWSVITEFLNYTKKGTPGPVKDLRVHQPKAHAPSNDRWTIAWAHPDYTGGYVQTDGKWGYASIKTYQVTVTQPGRVEPLRLENPDRPGYTDGWNDGKWTMTFDMSPTCRANDIPDFFYPCSHERTGFQLWLTEQVDVTKPLRVTVRAQNNTAHQGWSVTELEYTPVGLPSAPRNLSVTVDETDVNNGIPTGLHRMSWDAPDDDGGSPVHYLFQYSCTVLGGDQGNDRVEDLSYAREGTELLVRNPELSRNRPGTLRCDWIEVYARNSYFFEGPRVRWTAPPRESAPYVINPLGEIHFEEGSGDNEIDLSNVFHDPNGDPFTITREVVAGDASQVSEVSSDQKITVTAPDTVDVCTDQNGTRTCYATGAYHITLYADDGQHNYGKGGRSGPHRFRVIVDAKPEVLTFNPLVYDGIDLDGDDVVDSEADGRIDRREFQKVKDDYAACVDAGGNDPGNPLECNTGGLGHPYVNFLMMKALFERTNVRVMLTWSGGSDSDVSVPEDEGSVKLKATLWEPAPVDLTLTIHDSPGNVNDFTLSTNEIVIPKGETRTTAEYDTMINIVDDSEDEPDERFIILVSGTITGCVPSASGPNRCAVAGDAVLEIEDNDAGDVGILLNGDDPIELTAGAQGSYTVSLATIPSAPVHVRAVSPTDYVEVSPNTSHRITPGNWDQPVTFYVTAAADAPVIEDVRIRHTVSSLDANYDGISAPTARVSVVDAPQQRQSPVNHAPTVASPIADIDDLSAGDQRLVLLASVFSYDGNGELEIRAGSNDPSKATVTVSPDYSSLTVTGVSAGTATIGVTAQDPDGDRATDEFDVTVVGPSQQQADPPKSQSPGSAPKTPGPEPTNVQVVGGDGEVTVSWDVSPFYYEGREISADQIIHAIRWWLGGPRWANPRGTYAVGGYDGIHVENGVTSYTINGLTNGVDVEVQVRAFFGSNYTEAAIKSGKSSTWVKAVGTPQVPNNAPTVASAISDATIVNETGTKQVSLSGVFTDADSDSLTITAISSNESVATESVATDYSTLTVTAKKRGTATITVTANDGKATVDDTFTIKVKAAPVVASAIADITELEIRDTRTPSLSGVFSDADGDAITVTKVASSDTSKVSVFAAMTTAADGSISITGFTLTAKDSGTATITVTAQDSDGNTVNDTFDVTVNAPQQQQVNNAPTVAGAIDDATIINESGTHEVSLSGVFTDADEDSLTITAESSSTSVATVSVAADYSKVTVSAQSRGTATITITANDGQGGTVKDKFDVKVKAAPTVASPIADMDTVSIAAFPDAIDLTKVFSDADGDTLTFDASSTNDDVAWGMPFQGLLNVFLLTVGTVTFEVTAQDSDGNSVSDSFNVTVVKANNPPTVASAIDNATIVNEKGTKQVSLSGVFTDADSDSLTVTAGSSDEKVATVSVSTDQTSLTVTAKKRGTATVTVTAKDGNGGSVNDTFTVTVKAAPVVASAIADVSELEIDATHEVSMSGVFSDADGDALIVTAASSDNGVATVSVAADHSVLTVSGVAKGAATITVTAQDSDGNSVNDEFDVTVPAAQQQQAAELPGPVVSLELTASAENSVVVRWSAPENGGAPDGYIVHLRPENGEKGSGKTKRPKAKKTQVKFNNLQSGQTYAVWVRAQNEAGKGERVHTSITLPE